MARYQVILAYDGTEFHGFQRQGRGGQERTVQGEVEAALRRIGWAGRSILAAGRTDAGVHASGQVIAFDLDWEHPEEALLRALNANLPLDAAAQAVRVARPDFHPRYDARARRYQYRILCREVRAPLRERYCWRVWPDVSVEPMRRAAADLIGRHDFAAFGAPHHPGRSTVRNVSQAHWLEDGAELVFEIVGNAFLYHMVRRLVSTLVGIGQGVLPADLIRKRLAEPAGEMVPGLAPPAGLNLVEVIYPPERET